MPVYEYRCKNCGHGFELQQAMTDDAPTECPECGEHQLRKVFQPVGIAFKGSGFYKNDARSSSRGTSSSTAGSSSDSSPSSDSTSSSTKVESTSTAGSSGSSSD